MPGRFIGEWPKDAVGNPIKVKITSTEKFPDTHKEALSRAGKKPIKPLKPPTKG